MQNTLALFELLYYRDHTDDYRHSLVVSLCEVALKLGVDVGQISDALNSDRNLAIYEP